MTAPRALREARGVAVEMGVVEDERPGRIELVDGQPSRHAGEELLHDAVVGRDDGCAARRQDVDRFVAVSAAPFIEGVAHGAARDAGDWNDHRAGRAGIAHPRHGHDRR